MADELNQGASSQPATTAGTNAPGKPADAGSQTMTPSQQSDYYNKTQQLASERKAFEAERAKLDEERNAFRQQYNQPYGGQPGYAPQGFSQTPQFTPSMPMNQPPMGPSIVSPEVYAKLVDQFGIEGARAQVESIQQASRTVQGQLALADARLNRAEMLAYQTQIDAKGRDLFGKEYVENRDAVIKYIVDHGGCDLEYAMWKVKGGSLDSLKQQAMDEAYKNQQHKQEGNVSQQTVQPSGAEPTEFKSVGDAFQAAWKQHAGA